MNTYKVGESIDRKRSPLSQYKELMVGTSGWFYFIYFELVITLFSGIPGLLGLFLRRIAYRPLFKKMGRGVIIGKHIVLRHPHKISVADGSFIDDHVMLDAKGEANDGIQLEEAVFIGRNSILSCKNGNIILKARSNIGFNCELFASQTMIVGEDTLIAAYSYLLAGGTYQTHLKAIPVSKFPDYESDQNLTIGRGVWIGAHCVILAGSNIEDDVIIAAGSILNKKAKTKSIYAGTPAKLISPREEA